MSVVAFALLLIVGVWMFQAGLESVRNDILSLVIMLAGFGLCCAAFEALIAWPDVVEFLHAAGCRI